VECFPHDDELALQERCHRASCRVGYLALGDLYQVRAMLGREKLAGAYKFGVLVASLGGDVFPVDQVIGRAAVAADGGRVVEDAVY